MKNNFEVPSSSPLSSIEQERFPKAVNFLKEKAPILANQYRDPNGQLEHCGLLAIDVAKLILEEGGHPTLLSVRGRVVDSVGNRKTLVPKQYKGAITWGGHTVCENKGLIYDPMVGYPVITETYLNEIFTEPVTIRTSVASDKIQEFIDRK